MQTNNKLREAVKKLLDALYDMGIDENTLAIAVESHNCQMKSEHTLSVLKEVRAALAGPILNCEVGTVEEQFARFREFCKKGSRDSFEATAYCAYECPCGNNYDCKLAWAQMPYEEGGDNK